MWELMKSSVLTLHSVCTKTITRRPRPKIISPQTCWRSCLLVTPRKLSVASTTESICTSGFACLTCRCMSKRAKSMNSSVMWVTFLHPWVFPLKNSCYLPDFFLFLLQIFYKDDMNWLKGIGCYAWDTPEILRVKQAGILQSEVGAPRPKCLIWVS